MRFDKQKIVAAIEKAMADTPTGVDTVLSVRIADEIASKTEDLSVEEIQDIVETELYIKSEPQNLNNTIIENDYNTGLSLSNVEKNNNKFIIKTDYSNESMQNKFVRKINYRMKDGWKESFGFSFKIQLI